MSPFPARIQRDDLLARAIDLLDARGVDGLSLNDLAKDAGVRTASLYHHFDSKAALLHAVNLHTLAGLVAVMHPAPGLHTPDDQVRHMAHAYRAYAHTYPARYALLLSATPPDAQFSAEVGASMVAPLQAFMAGLVGAPAALDALRGLWALLHGYVTLELGRHFRQPGDLDAAFAHAVDAYIGGVAGVGAQTRRGVILPSQEP